MREVDTEVGRIAVGDTHKGGVVIDIVDCDTHVEIDLDRWVYLPKYGVGVNGFVYRKVEEG